MLKYNEKAGYISEAPPRDLTDEEVKDIEEREGITEKDLIASGAYKKVKEGKDNGTRT